MFRVLVLVLVLAFLVPGAGGAAQAVDDLAPLLEPLRAQFGLPALAAAVHVGGRLRGVGAVGVRRQGSPEPVTRYDSWHIGSITKSMTATLAARMVEEGALTWETRLAEVFPDTAGQPAAAVTLRQLVTNRAGLVPDVERGLWRRLAAGPGTPAERRAQMVRELACLPLRFPPGTAYEYSNQNFAVAGAMLERTAARPFEDLLQEKVLRPAGLVTAGYGAPAAPGRVDEPWGHSGGSGAFRPVAPGPGADNPDLITPAGRVHCSIVDLAAWGQVHVDGENRGQPWLPQRTFRLLHTPPDALGEYAYGWGTPSRPWAGGRALNHLGSNTMFFANLWAAPRRNFVAAAATNAGAGFEATDAVIAALIEKYL